MQQSNLYKKNKKKNIITYVLIGVVVILVVVIIWYFGFYGRNNDSEGTDDVNIENINNGFDSQEVSADIDYMRGTIGLKSADDAWKIIAEEVVLNVGDSLKTADASRAVVTVGSSAEMRMDENTEVTFTSLQDDSLNIEQLRGYTYHNGAQLMDSYLITALGAEIRPEGSAFAVQVDETTDEVTVYAISGDVEVNNATIAEGFKMTVADGETLGVEEITDEEYDSEWWTWNASRDEGEIDESDTNENENENTNTADEEDLEDEDANTNENTNTEEEEEAAKEEEEKTAEEPAPVPAAPVGSSITGLSSGGSGVSVSWSKSGGENFKYYRIVRSESNSNPTYPSDGYVFYSGNSNEVSFTDSNASTGKTYYYNVCVVDTSDKVTCGSGQSVNVK
ncbi:FecR family protein [Patescibacteria group bacterium]|nr:FecR family protein [Patescibacteria group bacterium]MBU1673401.1 FecR family protein [Patescibacteria group bacterium]MBU1963305.1 FecR family protein [Patescibacteria group bacterium]